MISSIIFAFLGYTVLAAVAILDKSILTKSLKHPAVYAFYSTIFSAVAFIFLPFLGFPHGLDIVWSILSGVTFGLGVWTMFVAFRYSEASHLSPFLGAVIAIVSLLLSYFVLGASLSLIQTVGVIFLIIASFLLSFEKSRAHQGFHVGFIWAILSAFLFSLSHISAKYIYLHYPFIDGLVWTRGAVCFVGLLIILIPRFRSQIFYRSPSNVEEKPKHISSLTIVVSNKILGIVSVLLIQYAISLGNVAVVNALAGIQYVLMFIFIFWLTKLYPKVFSEYFTRKELAIQSLSILLIVIGLIFL
jgi:drug/metabolite transporter (DMT)-like permease